MSDVEFSFKIVVMGNSGVGKTSLIRRYVDNKFENSFVNTLGVDFLSKIVHVDGIKTRLLIWDISGQSKFASFLHLFFKKTDFYVVAFSVDDEISFRDIGHWINIVFDHARDGEIMMYQGRKPMGIIRTKTDLVPSYSNNDDAFNDISDSLLFRLDTSAKTGKNVNEMFGMIARHLLSFHA